MIEQIADMQILFWDYAMELATRMTLAGATTVTYQEKNAALAFQKSGAKQEQSLGQDWSAFFSSKDPMLVLAREGVLIKQAGKNVYAFLHKSVQEYFTARQMGRQIEASSHQPKIERPATIRVPQASEISVLPQIQDTNINEQKTLIVGGKDFNADLIKDEGVIRMLAQMVEREPGFKEKLFEIVYASREDASVEIASANAMTVLNRARVSFSGLDLHGVRIKGANLSQGMFDSVDFRGADLRGVDLRQGWLRNTQLAGAQMAGVIFGEKPYMNAGSGVFSITYSPDGRTLASGSMDGKVRIWDTESGKYLATLQGHTHEVQSVVYSPDGKTLASGGNDGTVRIWDIESGECLKTLVEQSVDSSRHERMHGMSRHAVIHSRVSRDDRKLAEKVYSVAYSPDGKTLVAGSSDKMVRIWDIESGECLTKLVGHTGTVNSVVYSPDGQTLATGSDDNTVRIWDVQSWQVIKEFVGHSRGVTSVSYSPDGQTLATGSADNTVRVWDVRSGRVLTTLPHDSWVTSVIYLSDGATLASGGKDNRVRVWDVKSGKCLATLEGHTNWVMSIAYSPEWDDTCEWGLLY